METAQENSVICTEIPQRTQRKEIKSFDGLALKKLILQVGLGMRACRQGGNDVERCREISKGRAIDFFESLERHGIPTHTENFLAARQTPVIFGNHQAFGIEALAIYGLLPTKFRVALKDGLLNIPGGPGQGIKSLDPIVINRFKNGPMKGQISPSGYKNLKEGASQATIKNPVMIFLEGTRSKDGQILKIREALMQPAIEAVWKLPESQQQIGVLTTDSMGALPFGFEQAIWDLRLKANPKPIKFYLDTIDINPDMTIEMIRDQVKETMQGRLTG